MSIGTQGIIRDAYGIAVPQYYNPTTDAFEPSLGSGGAVAVGFLTVPTVTISGSVVTSGTTTATISGKPTIQGTVANDGTAADNPLLLGAYAHATGQSAVSADGDVVRLWADRTGKLAVWMPALGAHANAWSAAAVAIAGTSTSLDASYASNIAIFGNTSAATTFTVQYSQDNTNWYDSDITLVVAGAGNFAKTFQSGARYLRLKSSAAATITATISAKN